MPRPGQAGQRRHCVLGLSVHLSIRPSVLSSLTKRVITILRKLKPILMPIFTSGSRGKGVKSTSGVMRSKVVVTLGQKSLLAKFLEHYPTNFNQTW